LAHAMQKYAPPTAVCMELQFHDTLPQKQYITISDATPITRLMVQFIISSSRMSQQLDNFL